MVFAGERLAGNGMGRMRLYGLLLRAMGRLFHLYGHVNCISP